LTQLKKTFFDPKGKKMKNLGFLGEIFQSRPKPKMADPTRATNHCPYNLSQKILAWTHHLYGWQQSFFIVLTFSCHKK